MREIFLLVMLIAALALFYKTGQRISEKKREGILFAAGLMLVAGISIMINFTLIIQNDKLEEKSKKCPEYVHIENAYILKK